MLEPSLSFSHNPAGEACMYHVGISLIELISVLAALALLVLWAAVTERR
jgi:hypothetical protein